MKRIVGARDVDAALKSTMSTVKSCLNGVHQKAAHAMGKGKYEVAEQFIVRGKEIQVFQLELGVLRNKWRALKSGNSAIGKKSEVTPLWQYYQPILKALVELGGKGTREDISPHVEKLMRPNFLPRDTDKMSGGRQRWSIMIRRARKHLTTEGWLEVGGGKNWSITPEGRKAAAAALLHEPVSR